jgi:MFS family permease
MISGRGSFAPAGRAEWRRAWPVPFAAMIGSAASILYFTTLGFFLKPIQAETHWTLSQITMAVPIVALIGAVLQPLVGLLIDRVNARYVSIVGFTIITVILGAAGIVSHTVLEWWALWVVLGILADLGKAPVWAKIVTSVFDASRGLALAVTGAGLGLFALVTPALTMWLIDAYGWRMAYVYLAGLSLIVTLPITCVVFGNDKFFVGSAVAGRRADGAAKVVGLGLTVGQAVRGRQFWQLVVAGFCVGAGLSSVTLHFPNMLAEKGLSHPQIAIVAGTLGLTTLLGRIITGGLLDLLSGRVIGAVIFLAPTISCALYVLGPVNLPTAIFIATLFGIASGAEMDVIAFLTSRYIGLRSFGFAFASVMAGLGVGSGVWPQATSMLHDRYGSYSLATIMLAGILVLGAVVIGALGKVPNLEHLQEDDEEAAMAMVSSAP